MSAGQRRDLSGKRLRAETAERLEAIVEAAERAAEKVIDDAEAEAQDYLARARAEADRLAEGQLGELAELIDALLERAAALREEAERLHATLEAAKAQIEPDGPGEVPVPRLRAVPQDEETAPTQSRADAAGARLLATQMAVSGSSREEIESRLRNGFEIEDTSAILDAILGPED